MKLSEATIVGCVALAAISWAAPVSPQEPGTSLAESVAALSNDSYAVREKATRELWSLGDKALVELRKAEDGHDPEAAVRARDLIRKIELGILPDSSPKIVALVMRYDRGGIEEKRGVINELKRERAYRQILKLYALERNRESLEMLGEAARGVALEAARDCLAIEPPDLAGAFSYLDMARPDAPELMAKAALHRANGTLEQELKKAEQLEGEASHLWRYALLACAGRLNEAAAEAEKAGLEQTSARLQLLAGDPLPWLKTARPASQSVPAAGLEDYRQFAIRTWEGRPIPAELTRNLRRQVRGGDVEEQAKELRLLFLTGDLEEAEKKLAELDPQAAFYYFEATERVEDALKAIGLDPARPDYKGWALKRFRTLPDDDSDGTEVTDLALLGYFLEHRGLAKELEDVFVEPLVELSRADQEIFISTINRFFRGLFSHPAVPRGSIATVPPVLQSVARFAGDDEIRWGVAVSNLFDFLDDADGLWSWTARLDPSLDRPQRLDWLCRIFGFLPDVKGDRARFLKLAWQSIEREEGGARGPLVDLMAAVDDYLHDKRNTLRCIEVLGLEDSVFMLRQRGQAEASLGRWQEAAATWQKVVEMSPSDAWDRVNASISLRRSGDIDAADREERRAEMLALAEIQVQLACGNAFALSGDFDRAARWWRRAGAECTRGTSNFQDVLGRLGDHAQATGDWRSMAAFSEVSAFYDAVAGDGGYRIQPTFAVSTGLRSRIDAVLALALTRIDTDRDAAVAAFEKWSALSFAENSMADHFFAPLRGAGLTRVHDEIFERMWIGVTKRIRQFPDCDNSRNSAAWLASRANRRLDEAENYLEKALERNPNQAAYLDTMAEIHFARGDRKKAVQLSSRSLEEGAFDLQIVRQHQRFAEGAFPPK